jgi:ubiquinone/menaquinone biosynthesis C-methylase UbiE
MAQESHERQFHGRADRLRSAERRALLEVDRVVTLSVEGLAVRRVLDIGTGAGLFAEAFAARGYAVAGIDANGSMVEAARRFVPQVEFRQAAAEAIPYGDGAFDLAFLAHVLHETDDPVRALKEARRVSMARVVVLEWPYAAEEEHGPPLEIRLKPETVLEMARQAGLGRVEHLRLTHMDLYRMATKSHARISWS